MGGSTQVNRRAYGGTGRNIAYALLLAVVLSGCTGPRIIKEPDPLQTSQPLSQSCDDNVCAYLDWVIVRNGPGSWAKNAKWDEYVLRFEILGRNAITIEDLMVFDSLDHPLSKLDTRHGLTRASVATKKRYKNEKLTVSAGEGTGVLLMAGGVATLIGVGVAIGGYSGLALATAGPAGVVLAAPVLVYDGLSQNAKVNDVIQARRVTLPLALEGPSETSINAFFSFAPSPRYVEIHYRAANSQRVLKIDTETALKGLHFKDH